MDLFCSVCRFLFGRDVFLVFQHNLLTFKIDEEDGISTFLFDGKDHSGAAGGAGNSGACRSRMATYQVGTRSRQGTSPSRHWGKRRDAFMTYVVNRSKRQITPILRELPGSPECVLEERRFQCRGP